MDRARVAGTAGETEEARSSASPCLEYNGRVMIDWVAEREGDNTWRQIGRIARDSHTELDRMRSISRLKLTVRVV